MNKIEIKSVSISTSYTYHIRRGDGGGGGVFLECLLSLVSLFAHLVLVFFDKCAELDFAVERHDELLHVGNDRWRIEFLSDTAAHSSNRFKRIVKCLEWR